MSSVGLLAPRGNVAVREEMAALLGTTVVLHDLELVADGSGTYAGSLTRRIAAYLADLPAVLSTARGLGVDVVVLGHTGCSYVNHPAVRQMLEESAIPSVTAADALVAELNDRGLRSVELITPYPDEVHAEACRYWSERGIDVQRDMTYAGHRGARSIYELTEDDLLDVVELHSVGSSGADAVVIAGTGAPSVQVLEDVERRTGRVVLPVNLALARQTASKLSWLGRNRGGAAGKRD